MASYVYPFFDITNWEFSDFFNVAHKGYSTRVFEDCDGIYKFSPTPHGNFEIEVTNSLFNTEGDDRDAVSIDSENIIAASIVCSNGSVVCITDLFLKLRSPDGSWFSGHTLHVHELLPFFCEMTRQYAPLLHFDVLRVVHLDNFEIKHLDFSFDDVLRFD